MPRQQTGTQRAVIVFADILGSIQFALNQTPERYGEILRAFHLMAHEVIQEYRKVPGLGDDRLYAHAVGDEAHMFLIGGTPTEDECHALRLAVRLKQCWANSETGRDLAMFGHTRFGFRVDLRVGIGSGDVVLGPDVWTGRITPEGVAISEAKRIEGLAAELAPETLILVKTDIKEAAERATLGIKFGKLVWAGAKGYLEGTHKTPLYPVASWKEFKGESSHTTVSPEIVL